jgi:hypothetical protein
MAFDIAVDFKRGGDLVFTPNLDYQGVRGEQVVAQRIMLRLMVERGWIGDPTDALGSRLRDALHLPRERALQELRLYVEEALAPMNDVTIMDVEIEQDENDARSVRVILSYAVIEPGEQPALDIQVQERLTIDIPV